jgi:hypothetical protein
MHQTDIAQPYARWIGDTVKHDAAVEPGTTVKFNWHVNGSLVVDHTYMQWGKDKDPISNPDFSTTDHDEFAGQYLGGTGWDEAVDGETYGVTYTEEITLDEPGDYYFVAKAQVDQIYGEVLRPDVYGDDPYLRLVKERTDDNYHEVLQGTDGKEEIFGSTWWYSPIIHVYVINDPPIKPDEPDGIDHGDIGVEYTYETATIDPEGDQVFYMWDWGDGTTSDWEGPFDSAQSVESSHTWEAKGYYLVQVKAKDTYGSESEWSDPLGVTMPRNMITLKSILQRFLERIQFNYPIIWKLISS